MALLGAVGLVALSAGAYAMLAGLAAPPPRARIALSAADWPDLKDGVPALVGAPSRPAARAAPLLEAKPPLVSESEPAVDMRLAEPAAPPQPATTLAETKPADVKSAPAAKAPPPMVAADVIAPARAVTILPAARVAALIGPLPTETTRARAEPTAYAALPPEPASNPAVAPRKKQPAPVARAKPASVKPAEPAAAPPAAPAEPEEAELFGMKVPSLAPAGRKIAESVEALGDAVRNLPGF